MFNTTQDFSKSICNPSTVGDILERQEYISNTLVYNHKAQKNECTNLKCVKPEETIIIKNIYEAIIDKLSTNYEIEQKILKQVL